MAYSPYPSRYGRYSHPWPVDQSYRYAPSHPPTLLPGGNPQGGVRPPQAHAQPYTIQDYLRSLGYNNQAGYLSGLGLNAQPYTPMSDADMQAKAKALVDAQINPLLERLNTEYAGRAKMGSEAIQGLTQMLAGLASQYGPSVGKAYDEAIGQGQQLASGLADRLTGAGQGAAQETGGKLAAAGQDTSGASGLGDVGKFAGDAGFAKDTSALEALNAGKAADMAYGAKLPFIEGLTGAQQGQAFQSQLMAALGQDTASVTGQVPGLLQSIAESLMAQDQGKQDRSTAAAQARAQATLGLQQNYVSARNRREDVALHTKERGQSLAEQQRANAENTRRYNQQRQDTQNRQRLSIVAADAPTTRGRKAYWDAQAANRTANEGVIYKGTPTGMRPVIDPATGKPKTTAAENASQQAAAERKREFDTSARAAGFKVKVAAATTGAKLQQSAKAEANRHAEAAARIQQEQASTDERIRHNKAIERNAGASEAARASATRARVADEKRRAALTKASQAETARHHRATERTSASKPKTPSGTEPVRVGPGKWQTSDGRPLNPAGNAYWEKKFQGGFTDGKGHRAPGTRDKTGSSGGASGIPRK